MYKTLLNASAAAALAFTPLLTLAQSSGNEPDAPLELILPPPTNQVPEPASLALAGMALGIAVGLRTRRLRRSQD